MEIKVLTLNMHKGFSTFRGRYQLETLKNALQEINPHIVFLQEITGHFPKAKFKSDFESPLELLADSVWPHFAYGKNAIYQNGSHGNAILSQFPFYQWENIDISTNRLEKRGLLHGVVMVDESTPLHLLCVHLNLLDSSRSKQALQLSQRINEHCKPNDKIVLAGDFNDWRAKLNQHFINNNQFKEAHKCSNKKPYKTFPNLFPLLHLDRIYFKNISLSHTQVMRKAPWKNISDHLPILANFKV